MKLTKAIECGREEMSGRNQHMWDLKVVNNLEKIINVCAASDYLTHCVAVKHGAIVPVQRNVRILKVQPWLCENRQEFFALNMKPFNFQSSEIFKLEIIPTQEDV